MNKSGSLFNWLFYLWLLLIIFVSSIPGDNFSSDILLNWDKLAHFGEYFILILLFYLMQLSKLKQPSKLQLILLVIILPVLEESHQLLIPGRSFSLYDILADIAGASVAVIICKILEKHRKSGFNSF